MTRTIKHQFFFPHPAEKVWEHLTKSELLEQWLMKNDFQPILGHNFQFRTGPIPSLDFDGIFYCTVLEIIPFKKLSYSWKSRRDDGEIQLESIVVWRLESNDKGTQLFLEHSGFEREENLAFYNGLTQGWIEKLQKITNLINSTTHDATKA